MKGDKPLEWGEFASVKREEMDPDQHTKRQQDNEPQMMDDESIDGNDKR
jgi:hypothetical protein